jgi:hypothetical protein
MDCLAADVISRMSGVRSSSCRSIRRPERTALTDEASVVNLISHLIERQLKLSPTLTRDVVVQRELRVPMPMGSTYRPISRHHDASDDNGGGASTDGVAKVVQECGALNGVRGGAVEGDDAVLIGLVGDFRDIRNHPVASGVIHGRAVLGGERLGQRQLLHVCRPYLEHHFGAANCRWYPVMTPIAPAPTSSRWGTATRRRAQVFLFVGERKKPGGQLRVRRWPPWRLD